MGWPPVSLVTLNKSQPWWVPAFFSKMRVWDRLSGSFPALKFYNELKNFFFFFLEADRRRFSSSVPSINFRPTCVIFLSKHIKPILNKTAFQQGSAVVPPQRPRPERNQPLSLWNLKSLHMGRSVDSTPSGAGAEGCRENMHFTCYFFAMSRHSMHPPGLFWTSHELEEKLWACLCGRSGNSYGKETQEKVWKISTLYSQGSCQRNHGRASLYLDYLDWFPDQEPQYQLGFC